MFCCKNCFSDPILIDFIDANISGLGDCTFCGSKDAHLINCEELVVYFESIFELYTSSNTSLKSLKIDKATLMHEHILQYFPSLFNLNLLNSNKIEEFIINISKYNNNFDAKLFSEPVEFSCLLEDGSTTTVEGLELQWEEFAEEIKHKNRFFINEKIDTEVLKSIFERLVTPYLKGSVFYRSRISDKKLESHEMGKPPSDKTNAGRSNPIGIPYLYISNDLETSITETRVTLHESLTVGTFELIETLNTVSLKNLEHLGPFEIQEKGFTLEEFIIYRPYLQKLQTELSKPVRKQDSYLDYLPTQFLCEFIKSLGFDAVEYKSSMNPNGANLAVFNDNKIRCVDTNFYSILKLKYQWK